MAKTKRGFGQLNKLPSKRWRARYTGPDGALHNAPSTFDTKMDAEAWLADERRLVASGAWSSPKAREALRMNPVAEKLTFGTYADAWLRDRTLKPRTREHYRSLLDKMLLPTFEDVPLAEITPDSVRSWHALTGTSKPTLRAHAYGLLRTILGSATQDRLIPINPCHIRGAGNSKRVHKVKPATLPELETLVTAMPDRYRTMVLLASWCALRFGELAELRRGDVDTKKGIIRVRRGVVRAAGSTIVGTPKTDAGIRDVAIPPHVLPMVREHILKHAEPGKDGLLFPARGGGHLAPSSLYRVFYKAREAAGRPDLRFHDLRHGGAVLAAQTGATLAELMARLGHSTPGAAMRYQHAAQERDMEIARKLSALALPAD
ncbi:MAG: tyrosine-type recombinase/integrase [Marmoricola sp.]